MLQWLSISLNSVKVTLHLGKTPMTHMVMFSHSTYMASQTCLHHLQYTIKSLLAIVDISAVQSSAQIIIHNAISLIDTSNNAWYNQDDWLIGTPYLSTIASNAAVLRCKGKESRMKEWQWSFFLNGVNFPCIRRIWEITEAWIRFILRIIPVTCVLIALR